jgi:uncharacterized membrane protein YphA (DoxX/SURF4 family)
MRTMKIVALWTLQLFIGSMFVLVGVMKFVAPNWVRNFSRWGYPDHFYMVVGVLEAVGGVALFVPRLTTYAAVMLMTMMTGAVVTHLLHGERHRVKVPLVYLAVVALTGWLRRKSAVGLSAPATERHVVV